MVSRYTPPRHPRKAAPPILDSEGNRVRAYALGPPAKRTNAHPEEDFQVVAVKFLEAALPEPYDFYASAVGVNVGPWKGKRLKDMGVRADWADLTIVNLDTGGSRWLEVKSATGTASPGQKRLAARLGAKWAFARTLDQVDSAIRAWGIVPKCTVREFEVWRATGRG